MNKLIFLLLFLAAPALAQVPARAPEVVISLDGSTLGRAKRIDCSDTLTCSLSGGIGTFTVDETADFDFAGQVTLTTKSLGLVNSSGAFAADACTAVGIHGMRTDAGNKGDMALCPDGAGNTIVYSSSLGDAYNTISDGSTSASADGSETLKFEASSNISTAVTAGSPDKVVHTISVSSQAQGDIMYYNGSAWTRLAAGTSGQRLQTAGSGADPAWAWPQPGLVRKTGDTSRNSSGTGTTLTIDTHLQFTPVANAIYSGTCNLYVTAASETPDIKFGFTVPSGATGKFSVSGPGTSVTDSSLANAQIVASGSISAASPGIGVDDGVPGFILISFYLEMSSTVTTFGLQWAQNTLSADNTTVQRGSFCTMQRSS